MTDLAAPTTTRAAPTGISLAALVAMRLTHDLAGPIGAVATAVELLDGGDPEITALITDGAAAAVASLRLHRFILAPPSDASPARSLLAAWIRTRDDVTLDWHLDGEDAADAGMLLGLAMCAAEAARNGGRLTIEPGRVTLDPVATLDPTVAAALAGEAVTAPRAALAGLLYAAAAARGGAITIATDGTLRIAYQGSALPR